jgi:hypothetical protein
MVLPLESTDVPGIYRRGSKFVVVYRAEGRQHKQSVTTFAEARAFKLRRDAEARAMRRGPTLHEFSLQPHDIPRRAPSQGHSAQALALRRIGKARQRPEEDR